MIRKKELICFARKRALQKILEGLLGPGYDQVRPNGASAKRQRKAQIQDCKENRSARSNRRKTPQANPESKGPGLLQSDKNEADHFNSTLYTLKEEFADLIDASETNKAFLFDFEFGSRTNREESEKPRNSLMHQEAPLHPGGDTAPNNPLYFSPNNFGDTSEPPSSIINNSPYPYLDEVKFTFFDMEEPLEDHSLLATTRSQGEGSYSQDFMEEPYEMHDPFYVDKPGNSFQGLPSSGSPQFSSTQIHHDTGADSSAALMSRMSSPKIVDSRLSHARVRATTNARSSRASDLSFLIDRLSKCSSGEKTFIRDLLKLFSTSTLSSVSSSVHSHISITRSRLFEIAALSLTAPPASGPSLRSLFGPLDFPGDFITSSINTFSHHMLCAGDSMLSQRTFCNGCCRADTSKHQQERLSIPFAVMEHKTEGFIERMWSKRSIPWVDRFGNSSLHVAAALGASYNELQDIIHDGVSIDQINTGGQTFMHVLNPENLSMSDMLHLRKDLELGGFNFHHQDLQGKIFLNYWYLGNSTIDFVRCWSVPFLHWGPSERHLVNYDFVKQLFVKSRGSEEQWDSLGWGKPPHPMAYSGYHDDEELTKSNLAEELLLCPEEKYILFKGYKDPEDRNCLHAIADDTSAFPSRNIVVQSAMDALRPDLRLDLVRTLLAIGVPVNQYDKSGETPLMAHVRRTPSWNDIIKELLAGGAEVNARNCEGDSALHMSIQLGKIDTTRTLISSGANMHVRNKMGLGLLAAGERVQANTRENEIQYARIAACMALAIDAGAVASPDLFQEWSLPKWRLEEIENQTHSSRRKTSGLRT